jgi:NitT/TauT family transport system permease protein
VTATATADTSAAAAAATATAPVTTTGRRRHRYLLWRLAGYALFLGVWQLLATYVYEPATLPSPWVVVEDMWHILQSGDFWVNLWATTRHLLIGFALAFLLGTGVGILMGRSAYWDAFFRDYVMLTLTTPGLIFALIAVMVFGLSAVGPVVAIVLTTLPHVTVNVVEGVRAIPRELMDMASAFRVSRRTQLRNILLPAIAPFLFTAVRYGFAIAWKITALTELFGGADGVGIQIRVEYQVFNISGVLAWAFFLVGLSLTTERLVLQRLQDRFFRWRPEVVAS